MASFACKGCGMLAVEHHSISSMDFGISCAGCEIGMVTCVPMTIDNGLNIIKEENLKPDITSWYRTRTGARLVISRKALVPHCRVVGTKKQIRPYQKYRA